MRSSDTDDESADSWYSYPCKQRRRARHLSPAAGGGGVSMRVEGGIGPVLAARIEILFDLL